MKYVCWPARLGRVRILLHHHLQHKRKHQRRHPAQLNKPAVCPVDSELSLSSLLRAGQSEALVEQLREAAAKRTRVAQSAAVERSIDGVGALKQVLDHLPGLGVIEYMAQQVHLQVLGPLPRIITIVFSLTLLPKFCHRVQNTLSLTFRTRSNSLTLLSS